MGNGDRRNRRERNVQRHACAPPYSAVDGDRRRQARAAIIRAVARAMPYAAVCYFSRDAASVCCVAVAHSLPLTTVLAACRCSLPRRYFSVCCIAPPTWLAFCCSSHGVHTRLDATTCAFTWLRRLLYAITCCAARAASTAYLRSVARSCTIRCSRNVSAMRMFARQPPAARIPSTPTRTVGAAVVT
ncbi:hypothetical protein NPIL_186691 [Nephila pilipes]|uniref:Uncharacterized protein n=1 Tax=Nephila pilipes TaxID=299642 RepID=A0A8X6T1N6_NEPPI|nr:hypothetical protein NPIL_186691 [Nephila pilipes]